MEETTLEVLVRMGKITTEDIKRADMMLLNADRKVSVVALHTMLCGRDHDSDCRFYEEQNMENSFSQPEHLAWVGFASEILIRLDITWEDLNNILTAAHYIHTVDPTRNAFSVMTRIGAEVESIPLPQPAVPGNTQP